MKILILHGIGGFAGIHWQKWLRDELSQRGHKVIMPTLPDTDRPNRTAWRETAEKLIKDIDPADLLIVGHSLGVVTALDLIEQGKARALISIAGFARDYGATMNGYFLKENDIDFGKVNNNLRKAFVIYGDNDPYVPQNELEFLADSLRFEPEVIANGGHLNTDAGYTVFPRLLEIIQGEF
jgi:uncharacterized protein